jgi:hypothetical protein
MTMLNANLDNSLNTKASWPQMEESTMLPDSREQESSIVTNKSILENEIPRIVAFITSEIRSQQDKKEKWAKFKNQNMDALRDMIGLPMADNCRPGDVMGFDIDDERRLILLNYTGSAHNVLHTVENGWTSVLRHMRGLVYEFGDPGDIDQVRLVSRGFEKFFNFNEMPETRLWSLLQDAPDGEKVLCREKADGHMIEYFMHNHDLSATTRGKFGTASSLVALEMFDEGDFKEAATLFEMSGHNLMSLVVELVHPSTEVHVDYSGKKTLYLLAAYDTKGKSIPNAVLHSIADQMNDVFTMPNEREMTIHEMAAEVADRSVLNNEGWVVSVGDRLIKFKYISYIGEMVKSKLSYKYIMNCMKNDRLDKMLFTLPEEIREEAYKMVERVKSITSSSSYKPLYSLYSEAEGGDAYFKTVCREYWRECAAQKN